MGYVSEMEKALETALLHNERNMYGIYQLKPDDVLHGHRRVSYDTLRSEGNDVKRENYTLIYIDALEEGLTHQCIFRRLNKEWPADYHGDALSISDIIVFQQAGVVTAHYVNDFGFLLIPGFISKHERVHRKERSKSNGKHRQRNHRQNSKTACPR